MTSYAIPNVIAEHPRGERVLDVYSHLLHERIICLGTEIDDGVANVVIAQILHLASLDQDREISFYLNSPGGSLTAMFAVYDTMQFVRTPIATTCIGQAGSAAAVLLAAGAPGRRAVLPHSRVVLHQPSGQGRGAIPDLILAADEVLRLRSETEQVLSHHTGRSIDQLRRDTDRDRVFTAAQAVEYGLADHITTP
ncbi:MAG TPA: ATP-dependent Clp protease proteolytic subunit [Candidatus Avipropionibacterium avicola]|uniref:ATP-dependent Clp protease proteolytic subunit n=1 Tax=Candidatus Avipropionibacterium avicola TaxID=2840701 RepID=A0A9D1KNF4_9ACTN|nr:ATP-dependent Clp protease proteolytic subunit [Candidatus Avipropionibacterium avicola]